MSRILVVEENEQSLALISKYLLDARYDCITAQSGQLALRKAKLFKPDLIIIDPSLDGLSGYDVCKSLRNTPETKDILILIATPVDTKEARTKAFESGADDYMVKSFEKTVYLGKIKSLLRISELGEQLKHQYAALEEKDKLIESQLKMARLVQLAIIQEYDSTINKVSFKSKYLPALDVSGDIYDILEINNDETLLMLADVSGHGISAALVTSMIKMMFKNIVNSHITSPEKIIEEMNRGFCAMFENISMQVYTCIVCALFNSKNKTVLISNAGQALPVMVNFNTSEATELLCSGTPLGMIDDCIYEYIKVSFSENDLLMFYTDGLTDCFYKESPELFLSKLKEVLIDSNDSLLPLAEIIGIVVDQFYNMAPEAQFTNDDVSIILCRM